MGKAADAAEARDGYLPALERAVARVCGFLESKSFFTTTRSLRAELAVMLSESASPLALQELCVFVSDLDQVLGLPAPHHSGEAATADDKVVDWHKMPPSYGGGAALPAAAHGEEDRSARLPEPSSMAPSKFRKRLVAYSRYCSQQDEDTLRMRHGPSHAPTRVCFHDAPKPSEPPFLEHLSLPMVYNPRRNALEDTRELKVEVGTVIVGRYRVVASIGKGSFSRVFQCYDLRRERMVSVKVLRNEKDCLDGGLGEIRMLSLLGKHDPAATHRLRLLDYFYYKEHLLIVTELLRDSLYQFYKYIEATEPTGLRSYFTLGTVGKIAHQLLQALALVHSVGAVHCDVKCENVCLSSATRREIKLIDFGSVLPSLLTYLLTCLLTYLLRREIKLIDYGSSMMTMDTTNSYVQSRWYRAPEVIMGLKWDCKIDMWSLGCLLCELILGEPLFHGGK